MSAESKKALILRLFDEAGMTRLGEPELSRLRQRLVDALGSERIPSQGYIARVLAEAGKPVMISDAYSLPVMETPYHEALDGVLRFASMEQAESSLLRLRELYAEYKARGDRKGMAYVRSVVQVGKRRAQAAAKRAHAPELRDEKAEIVEWFIIWMTDPELFEDWLFLRKKSVEFRARWGEKGDS